MSAGIVARFELHALASTAARRTTPNPVPVPNPWVQCYLEAGRDRGSVFLLLFFSLDAAGCGRI